MAEPLLETSPVFRRAVNACADALKPHGVNLLAEFGKEEGWKHPALAMVGLVAIQVSCAHCFLILQGVYGGRVEAAPPCPSMIRAWWSICAARFCSETLSVL